MKNKGLIIITIIFFLTVNTTYYWEGKLGLFAFPAFLILVVVYLGLGFALIRQIYFAIREKFIDKVRLINIGLLTIVLILTFLSPFGLIDFDKLEGGNVLIAEREGSANCMTRLKLKDNFTFTEKRTCFGVEEMKGTFHIKNDTIYFAVQNFDRDENEFYKFATIESSKVNKDKNQFELKLYKSLTDKTVHKLWITKNDLNKLKNKS